MYAAYWKKYIFHVFPDKGASKTNYVAMWTKPLENYLSLSYGRQPDLSVAYICYREMKNLSYVPLFLVKCDHKSFYCSKYSSLNINTYLHVNKYKM